MIRFKTNSNNNIDFFKIEFHIQEMYIIKFLRHKLTENLLLTKSNYNLLNAIGFDIRPIDFS